MKAPTHRPLLQRCASRAGGDAGFTLTEVAVVLMITTMLFLLLPPIIFGVSRSTFDSRGLATGSGQAKLALTNLDVMVGSANEICLPTTLTTTGPTVTSGFAVRVLTESYGQVEWVQWMVDTTTKTLQEQDWPTTWVTGDTVPPWVTVASSVVNSSAVPFSLPSPTAGSPETLAIDLQVNAKTGGITSPVEFKTTIAALNTPYTAPSGATACATTED